MVESCFEYFENTPHSFQPQFWQETFSAKQFTLLATLIEFIHLFSYSYKHTQQEFAVTTYKSGFLSLSLLFSLAPINEMRLYRLWQMHAISVSLDSNKRKLHQFHNRQQCDICTHTVESNLKFDLNVWHTISRLSNVATLKHNSNFLLHFGAQDYAILQFYCFDLK